MRWIAAMLLLTGSALAGTRDSETPDAEHLEAGARFRAYACEVSGDETPTCRAKGSGVAIAPEWVLTAAHVVQDMNAEIRVRLADGTTIAAAEVVPHPEFRREAVGQHDLAIVKLAKPIAAKTFPKVAKGHIGRVAHPAGFGMNGTFGGDSLEYDGRLRAGNALVRSRNRTCLVCVADRGVCERLYCIASGDSGGPLLDRDGNVIGIHSYTARTAGKRRGDYGEESAHTEVWLYRDWIAETIGAKR